MLRLILVTDGSVLQVVVYKSGRRWRKETRKVAEVVRPPTPVDEVTLWNDTLSIPPLPPTGLGRCKIIDVTYELEVGFHYFCSVKDAKYKR